MLNARMQADDSSSDGLSTLSPREREVLGMTAQGLTNRQVADELHVTVHAVKFHLASSFRKLGVTNRTEAAVAFLRGQLGTPTAGSLEA
jgi:two-component system, NarL family, nitrate/nitrite response regulator NarL